MGGRRSLKDAFRDALGRMFTRTGEDWLDNIPSDAYLTLGDVERAKDGESMRIIVPQTYSDIEDLTKDHELFTLMPEKRHGCFYGRCPRSWVLSDQLLLPYMHAVSGTGGDCYYKVTPSLLKHAAEWT